jgi:ABC-type transport system substrate-binding protein
MEVEQRIIPATQFQDRENSATFAGFRMTSKQAEGDSPFITFTTKAIGTMANRWMGTNYGGYVNPQFDRLVDVFQTSLDRGERNQAAVQGMKLISDEVPGFALYYSYRVAAHVGDLVGPRAGTKEVWDANQWEWARR